MKLPAFELQALWLDAGWSVVLTALALAVLSQRGALATASRRRWALLGIGGAVGAAMLLPAPWSPSFWLGMAFQYPSLLLAGLAAGSIVRLLSPPTLAAAPLLPALPAATLLGLAAALYAGAFGWVSYDLYAVGYGPYVAAAVASVLVALWAGFDRRSGWLCCALAAAALLHTATRLPTGNAWDALLDPFLAAWAAVAVLRAASARRGRRTPAAQGLGQLA